MSSSAPLPRPTPHRVPLHCLPARVRGALPTPLLTPTLQQTPRLTGALPQVQALHLPAESWMLIKRTTSTMWESVGAPETEKTFHCPFCLENVRQAERVTFAACGNENHGVCRECMGHYIRGLVADGRVTKIECHNCGASAAPAEVLQLTDTATFRKFERFQQMQQDHTVRECPSCSRLCKPSLDEESNPIAEMQCPDCGTEFCYYHSNAHTGISCGEYRKRMAREERLVEQGALRDTKACPVCGVRTEKTGGCNHMTCQRCGSDWCWVCGKKLDDVTAHYYFGGPFACGQFEDLEPRSPLSHLVKCITVPLQLLSVLLFVLLSLTMLIWFPLMFLLLAPCYLNKKTCIMQGSAFKCVLLCSVVLAYIPFVVFQLFWTMCAALIWFVLRLFGAERRHLYNLVRSPIIAVLPVLICFQVFVEYFRGPEDELESLESGTVDNVAEQPTSELEAVSGGSSEASSSPEWTGSDDSSGSDEED